MKADMGLDERNAGCFLHTYSVVMVLRKVTTQPEFPGSARLSSSE